MDFQHNTHLGFVYYFEHLDVDGNVISHERIENIIPNVGRDYILNAALNGGSQFNTWYLGVYEANRTPIISDTMTSLIADCQECTQYNTSGGLRKVIAPDALSGGVWSNLSTPIELLFTSEKTIYGGFICSNAAQGATAGTLLSAVKNGSPKQVGVGETLRVTAGLSLITV